MKAEEPGSARKAEKYGMPIRYAPRIIDRHFGVVDEQAALEGAQIAHDIKVSNLLRQEADRKRQLSTPPPAPAATPGDAAIVESQDWRAKLGLG